MTKRAFWSIFLPAWKEAFTSKNISSGFEKTGIFPYKPRLVLDVITKPLPIEPTRSPKTLMSYRAVRRTHRVYKFKPRPSLLSRIFRVNERLAVDRAVSAYVIRRLTEALKNEKKKRRRGKRLTLLGQEDSGPQFYSPIKVQAAREFQTVKEEAEIVRRQEIEERKAQAAAKKKQKEEEKT